MPSEVGDEQAPEPMKSMENLEQTLSGEKLKADSDYWKDNLDHRTSTADPACDKDKDKEKKKLIKPVQEPFEAWEREEMEKLLGELRGHLGKIDGNIPICNSLTHACHSHIPDAILRRRGYREQFPFQRGQTIAATDLQLIHSP